LISIFLQIENILFKNFFFEYRCIWIQIELKLLIQIPIHDYEINSFIGKVTRNLPLTGGCVKLPKGRDPGPRLLALEDLLLPNTVCVQYYNNYG
jgi:hypothetical protein